MKIFMRCQRKARKKRRRYANTTHSKGQHQLCRTGNLTTGEHECKYALAHSSNKPLQSIKGVKISNQQKKIGLYGFQEANNKAHDQTTLV